MTFPTPRIKTFPKKLLAGIRLSMSLTDNLTPTLWKTFIPRRAELLHSVGSDLYSIRVYPVSYFKQFALATLFDKWAAIEVSSEEGLPEGFETLMIPKGLYAVFPYKGAASAGGPFYQYIYGTWIPNSEYQIDSRPHFEILSDKYKNDDPDSEEDIYIPIILKS